MVMRAWACKPSIGLVVAVLVSLVPAWTCQRAPKRTTPASDGDVRWPNEPAGLRTIVDAPFDAIREPGWQCVCSALVTIQPDATAPHSPVNVLEFSYPVDFPGGVGPGNAYYNIATPWPTEVYIGFWWKPSNPWQGHSSGVNKLLFVTTGGTQSAVLLEMFGSGAGPFRTLVVTEFPTGVRNWSENQGSLPAVTLGQWHRMELHLRYADGLLEWWMDGQLRGRYTGLAYPFNGFDGFKFAPTWGGVDDVKVEQDYFWYDHVHASRP